MALYDNLEDSTNRTRSFLSDLKNSTKQRPIYRNLCLLSVSFGFVVGLLFGFFFPFVYVASPPKNSSLYPSQSAIRTIFFNNSFAYKNSTKQDATSTTTTIVTTTTTTKDHGLHHPTISFIETSKINSFIKNGIYWGNKIEDRLPQGFKEDHHNTWAYYVQRGVAVKLENGCGRMQNRLLTFADGRKGCVRYRQNTDQIQGELFSFYLAQILRLPNLAPSTVSTVNLKTALWSNLGKEIAAAQWNSNRAVVLTEFISDLSSANIPSVFKPVERHLNKFDVFNLTRDEIEGDESAVVRRLVELAQWSDLIIFDYLTANLDRIVNNLYNYQWNVNIMDAPAHNLAKRSEGNLLVFLDNESGLLHGYRLLKKYEVYHSVLLDNLCLFRKQTADIIRSLRKRKNVGLLLRNMFEKRNDPQVKDVLPTLPDKSIKILNERIEKVYAQIAKCESIYFENDRTS